MEDFLLTYSYISLIMLLAEFGDKTNILLISLIAKYKKTKSIITGGLLGITIVSIIGVLVGEFIAELIPIWIIAIISAIIFFWLGLATLREDDDEVIEDIINADETDEVPGLYAFTRALLIIGLAEFGDKSQIFVITSSAVSNPLAVFLGAITGMAIIFLVVGIVGATVLSKIPESLIQKIAAILFIIAGIWMLISVTQMLN